MLDISKLGKGLNKAGQTSYVCPACLEEGSTQIGNPHLTVFSSGKFNCIKYTGDKAHNKRIFELARTELFV